MYKKIIISACLAVASIAHAAYAEHWAAPVSATHFMHIAGKLTIDGQPPAAGDEIGIFDSAGALVGLKVIAPEDISGTVYTDLAINADNPATPAVVEGARQGDVLSLRVWSTGTGREYAGSQITLATSGNLAQYGYQATSFPLMFADGTFAEVDITAGIAAKKD